MSLSSLSWTYKASIFQCDVVCSAINGQLFSIPLYNMSVLKWSAILKILIIKIQIYSKAQSKVTDESCWLHMTGCSWYLPRTTVDSSSEFLRSCITSPITVTVRHVSITDRWAGTHISGAKEVQHTFTQLPQFAFLFPLLAYLPCSTLVRRQGTMEWHRSPRLGNWTSSFTGASRLTDVLKL